MYGVPFCIGGVCVVIVPAVKRGDKQVRQIDGEPERILVIIIRDADDLRAGLPGLERVEDLLIGPSVAEGFVSLSVQTLTRVSTSTPEYCRGCSRETATGEKRNAVSAV